MPFVIPFFIPHQGCPHQCLFCNQNSITGKERSRLDIGAEIAAVIDEWLGYRKVSNETQFAFYGGSFTCLPGEMQEEMLAAVGPWLERGEIDTIRLSTRPDCIDRGRCTLLQRYGVGIVELGVQSFDDQVLAAARRGHTGAQSVAACRELQDAGIQTGIQLMPGLPSETRSSFISGVRQAIELRPAFVRLYPTLVVAGSPLAEQYENGKYRPLSLGMAVVLVAYAHALFSKAGIRVVRMGLQPSVSLERSLLGGPYHPAFGELVLARRWLRKTRKALAEHPEKRLRLTLSPRDLSAFNGMHNSNRKRLRQLGLEGRIEVVLDENIERGTMQYAVCK